jgi:transcription initiation factor TFIIIB Brf1 subunit/transcription initiation factor TFIIB
MNKTKKSHQNMWNAFDNLKKNIQHNIKEPELKCVYNSEKNIDLLDNETTPNIINSSPLHKNEIGLCEICNFILIISDEGFNLCSNPKCGILYTNSLDYSPEWKFHNSEDKVDPARCGNPVDPLLQESSYSGKILCSPNSSYELRKVCQWTKWKSMPHKEKSLNDELQYITIMAQKAGINEIFINHAMYIYKDLLEQKMFRGINRDSIKASSIYMACRLNGFPRTSFEIAEIFNIDKASANSGCSIASDLMHNIERSIEPSLKLEISTTTPLTFIERFCCRLKIEEKFILLAKFIANEIENNNLIDDNNPQSISSGIILFISNNFQLNITKKDIKDISGVSPVSMTKVSKKLELLKQNLIPACFYE